MDKNFILTPALGVHTCQILKVIYKCINPTRTDLAVATPGLHARARLCAHTLTPRQWVSGLAQMCARTCPCAGILSYISCAMSACKRNIRNGMHASPRQHANALDISPLQMDARARTRACKHMADLKHAAGFRCACMWGIARKRWGGLGKHFHVPLRRDTCWGGARKHGARYSAHGNGVSILITP